MPIPAFLRRFLLLRRARRSLEAGDAEAALATLADPGLALAESARVVREAAIEQAERAAARALASGDRVDLARWTRVLALEDPARAVRFEAHLAPATAQPGAATPLARLLAEMRAARDPASARTASARERGRATFALGATTAAPVRRFHLAVDDGGELLIACGTSFVVGHLRSPGADLPFLADIEAEHARLFRDDTFYEGAGWRIAPMEAGGSARIVLNGRALAGLPASLCDGDEVELAANLAFRFRTPEVASASALLELSGGCECEGVRRILLLAGGEPGRVRIGSKQSRHVPVADLAHEIALVLRGSELVVRCAGGVGRFEDGRPPESATEIAIPCPPERLVHLRLGARATSAPPFGLTLRPSEPPPRTARATGSA